MTAWLQQLSPLPLAIVCSGAFVLLTWFGIIFVPPFLRLLLRPQPGANDLVSYTSSWFSLLYGLLLGLLAVATYHNAAQIQTSVQREAATLALLYRGSVAYPEPLRSELQFLLRDYTLYVVHKDWPAHHQGRILQGGAARKGALIHTLETFGRSRRRRRSYSRRRGPDRFPGPYETAGDRGYDVPAHPRADAKGRAVRAGPAKREGRPARRRPPCACVAC